jgi:WD40 repeat protein
MVECPLCAQATIVPVPVAAAVGTDELQMLPATVHSERSKPDMKAPSSMQGKKGATKASIDKAPRRRKKSPVLALSLIIAAALLLVLLVVGIAFTTKTFTTKRLLVPVEQKQAAGANPPPQPTKPRLLHSIPWLVPEQGFHAHVYTRISSDGRLLMAVGDTGPKGAIRIWELATGKQVQQLVLGGDPWFHHAEFLPGSKQLITSYSAKKDLYLWDIEKAKVVRTFVGPTQPGLDFAVSPDGKRLLSWSDDKAVRLWNIESGEEMKKLEGHAEKAAGVFSPDSKQVLTFSPDRTLRLWSVETGKELNKFEGHTDSPSGCFSPDGKQILSYGPDQTIRLWDVNSAQEVRQFGEVLFKVPAARFAADGRLVVSRSDENSPDKKFRIWETATGKLVSEIDFAPFAPDGWTITESPDGRLALVSHGDGSVRVLDLATGKEIHRYDNCRLARGFSFSADGTLAAAGSFRQGVFVFRLPSLPAGR